MNMKNMISILNLFHEFILYIYMNKKKNIFKFVFSFIYTNNNKQRLTIFHHFN